ncbi:MAG: HAD family hydrolase [Parachlamydiales bacterium]|jgi:hypothetical protein
MRIKFSVSLILVSLFLCLISSHKAFADIDPLPSWNEGKTKTAILDFVKEVTVVGGANYVHPQDRIATFDQDGTLWVEQPAYTEWMYAMDNIKLQAPEHPEWKGKEPFLSIVTGNEQRLRHLSPQEIAQIIAITHSGMSVDKYLTLISDWLRTAEHPRYKRRYTDLIYQPMLEVIDLFHRYGFKTYIVSGGGQEFIRVYSEEVYGIPTERVIGSTGKVEYQYNEGKPYLLKLPQMLFVDDKKGKPEGINLIIGKRPIAAFGNSTGDQQMLEWTQAGKGKRLELLVHHDDAVREYAYGEGSPIGTFSNELMREAENNQWLVVSMKNDWRVIFPWERH